MSERIDRAEQGAAAGTEQLVARSALPEDLDAFLEIARVCVEEAGGGRTFSEKTARFVFAGLARADPAITLLLAGAEVVGFSLMSSSTEYLTGNLVASEDIVFVRADKRCGDGELQLHAFAHTWFEHIKATEAYLLVPASEHADTVRARLCEHGYRAAGERLAFAGSAAAPKRASGGASTRTALH